MKTPMLFISIWFTQILLITNLPLASTNLIDDTCKKTLYPDLCATALKFDRRSSTADTRTLGLIMVDKVEVHAHSTLTKIRNLRGKAPQPRMKQALNSCAQSYKIIISAMVPPSKEALTKGDYKFAVEYLNAAADEVSACEAGFGGSKSPISDLNDYEHKASMVASAIAGLLL